MTATRTTCWVTLAAGLLLACASAQAMDLRDMPQWVREMIEPVEIDWPKFLPPEWGVHLAPIPSENVSGTVTAPARAPAEPQGVHLGGSAEEITAALGELELLDPRTVAKAGLCLSVIEEQHMTGEDFIRWARENGIGPEAMTAAIAVAAGGTVSPSFTHEYRVLAAGLFDVAGDQLEHLDEIPVAGRPYLAIYLGFQGRGEDVKRVLSSMSPSELDALPGIPHYYVATQLCWNDKCLRTAIWAWKTEAARRGAMDRALVCFTIRAACRRLGDPKAVREELIPWAEEALAVPGSESQWHRALPALLWAYDYVGERQKAIERGRYWLQEAKERDVSAKSLAHARHLLDSLTDTTDASPPGGG